MASRRGSTNYRGRGGPRGGSSRGNTGGGGGNFSSGGRFRKTKTIAASSLLATDGTSSGEEKFEAIRLANEIDERMGFARFESGPRKVGWLINMHSVSSLWSREAATRKRRGRGEGGGKANWVTGRRPF